MMGRWRSGAPLPCARFMTIRTSAADPLRNNDCRAFEGAG